MEKSYFIDRSQSVSQRKGAIILGGHIQAYGIIRQLGEMKIKSVVIDKESFNIAKYSKYCQSSYVIPYSSIFDFLMKLTKDGKYYKWLIIPTDDYYVRIVSQYYDELSQYYNLLTDKWGKVSVFYNKCRTYPYVDKLGIPIPKTFYPKTIEELKDFGFQVKYPCIIKPAIMKDFYSIYGSKVLVCNDYKDLISKYQEVIQFLKAEDLMIQEIIPGSSENQYSIGLFSVQGNICNYIIVRRKRQHPPLFGNATTYAETVNKPILLQYANRIIEELKFTGVCEIEFKYDSTNNDYKFLEVNPRFWKWHLITYAAGVPMLKSIISYFYTGEAIKTENYNNAAWRDIVTDIPTIFNYIYKGIYVKPRKYKEISAVANFKDPKPFFMQLLYLPYLYKTRR
jgi:predicted ATP-grasp superfamily ATP-dependent carboligase